MSESMLISYREAAEMLGIDKSAVGSIVCCLGLTPKRIRCSARAKGLDATDMRIIRARLRPVEPDEVELLALAGSAN